MWVESFIVYVWRGTLSVSVTATEESLHVKALKEWAESLGYRVTVTTLKSKRNGSEHGLEH